MPDTKQYYIEDIEEGTHKAIADLDIQCSASLVFKCTPKNAMLSIDGQADFECNSNPVPVVPGRHTVYAKTASGFLTFEPVAVTGQVTEVNVTIEDYNPIPIPKYTLEGLTNTSRNYKIAGYTLLGAGILGAGISGGLTGYYYSDDRDAHKTDLIYSYTFLGISSAMAVTGAILLIIDALTYQPIIDDLKNREIDSDIIAISPMISSSFSGISLLGRF